MSPLTNQQLADRTRQTRHSFLAKSKRRRHRERLIARPANDECLQQFGKAKKEKPVARPKGVNEI